MSWFKETETMKKYKTLCMEEYHLPIKYINDEGLKGLIIEAFNRLKEEPEDFYQDFERDDGWFITDSILYELGEKMGYVLDFVKDHNRIDKLIPKCIKCKPATITLYNGDKWHVFIYKNISIDEIKDQIENSIG